MDASRLQLKQADKFYNDLLAGKSLTDMVPSPPQQKIQLKQADKFYNDLLAGKSLTDMVPSPPQQKISEIRRPRKDLLVWLTTP